MMYAMKRTNIYLEDRQLDLLGRVAEAEDSTVAALVRMAVDDWLVRRRVRAVPEDAWARRLRALLERRKARGAAAPDAPSAGAVDRDVAAAVREVRRARRARRR
jgi:hypothetical protein